MMFINWLSLFEVEDWVLPSRSGWSSNMKEGSGSRASLVTEAASRSRFRLNNRITNVPVATRFDVEHELVPNGRAPFRHFL
jgi:hypothetical protein